jgi:hypothetical protein
MIDLSHFQFESNPLWNDVIKRLEDMIDSEVSEALTQNISSEARSHQCGRAEALTDFKHSLMESWEKANSGKNMSFNP